MITERTTKYSIAVMEYLRTVQHATNLQILMYLRAQYPELTATTVHRITARKLERGEIAAAPITVENSVLLDANTQPHDHFHCSSCDMVRDANITEDVRPIIEKSVGDGCTISGRLVVSGLCKKCNAKGTK